MSDLNQNGAPSTIVPLMSMLRQHVHVAYLSSDLLFDHRIHTGAGGLGVVAGSIIDELEFNFTLHQTSAVMIGFYCSHGYQTQRITEDGVMEPVYERDQSGLVVDTGTRFRLILHGRECWVAVRTPVDTARKHVLVLLLDTDIPENSNAPDLQMITRVLYGERHATAFFSHDHQAWDNIDWMRVLQSAVLGLGSYYALQTLGVTYDIVHLNDSHPVLFLVHELGLCMKRGLSYDEALAAVGRTARFTNHTVLESGNKRYPTDYILQLCGHYAGFTEEILHRVSCDGRSFRMTTAALTLVGGGHANAVSKDHARIASDVFGYKFFPITNGVYVPKYQDQRFAEIDTMRDLLSAKAAAKRDTYQLLRERVHAAGCSGCTMHPQEWQTRPLIVWARRGQEYKRAGLLWHQAESELVKTLLEWRFVSIAWGGLVHPDDADMMRDWNKYFRRMLQLPNVMPVLNYRLDLMRPHLKAAADVWLNTPWFGYEACGTSWMSAMMNCALVVSIPDGGVMEAEHIVPFGSDRAGDWHTQYEQDARALWQTLLQHVCRFRSNDPSLFAFLIAARDEAVREFSATRMVTEYRKLLWQ